MKFSFKLLLFFVGVMTFTAGTAVEKGFVGTWDYIVETPDIDYKGLLTIKKDGKAYSGDMANEAGKIVLQNVKVETNKLTFKINVEGYDCYATLTLEGDALKGKVDVEGQAFPMEGTRKE